MNNSVKNKPRKVLVIFMGTFFVLVIGLVYFLSMQEEKAEDPRVKHARMLYNQYNNLAAENNYREIIALMDSIESIYDSIPHYKYSFEMGVIHNNRCAAFLSMYLNKIQTKDLDVSETQNDSLLDLAEYHAHKSIDSYNSWNNRFESKTKQEIRETIENEFLDGMENVDSKQQQKFLSNRVESLINAQKEINRRQSIAYTNLGIIYRHRNNYEKALLTYNKAIEKWNKNLTAENNRNILLGRPIKKHRMIDKFMPAN